MGRFWSSVALAVVVSFAGDGAASAAGEREQVVKARNFYNLGQYDEAIEAAEQARALPDVADSADLIAARARLERFRQSAVAADLIAARDRLRRIDAQRLSSPEQLEFLVGLGETLYLDDAFAAAADLFDSVLIGPAQLAPAARERVLDWWATALDRSARPRSGIERQGTYQRIRSRMEQELGARPGSPTAAYWAAAAARNQGDLDGAWAAAQSGWARASLVADGGASLRSDLDQLVLVALVPDLAKILAQPPDTLRLEWEQFKEKWAK